MPAADASPRLVVAHEGRELSGVVRHGESAYEAALRTTATANGDPVPHDLSAQPHRWVIDHDRVVSVRAMTRGDLRAVARWRAAPHVDRWWHPERAATWEAVRELYSAAVDGMTPMRMWVVEVNGRSVGFIQDYRVGDFPGFAILAPDPDAIGCDYVIGEPEWVGRGIGTHALWVWMLGTRRRRPEATSFFAAPDHRNAVSLRMLDKLGFVRGTWFDQPRSDGSVATCVGCSLDVRRVLG